MSPLRIVEITIFNGFTPQPPKGGGIENEQFAKSPL